MLKSISFHMKEKIFKEGRSFPPAFNNKESWLAFTSGMGV